MSPTPIAPLLVRRARLLEAAGFRAVDLRLADGRIAAVAPAGTLAPEGGETVVEAEGGLVLPAFVDLHTHLDKGHVWPRQANPDGTFTGALLSVAADRAAHWSAPDVEARMDFALRSAFAHGTAAIRTHLDSAPPQYAISWPVFAAMRERWAGRIELQASALIGPDQALDKPLVEEIARTAKAHGGHLGGAVSRFAEAGRAIANLVDAAGRHGLDLDLHIDESEDPASRTLDILAARVLETGFAGRVLAGHCCSLAVQPETEAMATVERVARAGIAVVSLPMCNLFLQDRHAGRTPRWRGVTLLAELKAAGVAVALASDNTRDPFYAYGDLDMLEVLREAVRIGHLDFPAGGLPGWIESAAGVPARIGGFRHAAEIREGAAADLVLVRARAFTELFARPQSDRTVIRGGRVIDRALPDYRELDAILGAAP